MTEAVLYGEWFPSLVLLEQVGFDADHLRFTFQASQELVEIVSPRCCECSAPLERIFMVLFAKGRRA